VDIQFLYQDAFAWSQRWETDPQFNFFRASDQRIFFYQSDEETPLSLRDNSVNRGAMWPRDALYYGYLLSAGAMSDPGPEAYLRPNPFFDALTNGATIGEAFLVASPYLNWTLSLIGDPLVTVDFPATTPSSLVPEVAAIEIIADNLARSSAYFLKKEQNWESIRDSLLTYNDVDVKMNLFFSSNSIVTYFDGLSKSGLLKMAQILYGLPYKVHIGETTNSRLFQDYLNNNSILVSELFVDIFDDTEITSEITNLKPEGSWRYEIELAHAGPVANYTFQIQVATDCKFSNIVVSADSSLSLSNWYVETAENSYLYSAMTGPIPSTYVGRNIRFDTTITGDYPLTRANLYYFRMRQYDGAIYTNWVVTKDIIFT
jgi:hypothetical protein